MNRFANEPDAAGFKSGQFEEVAGHVVEAADFVIDGSADLVALIGLQIRTLQEMSGRGEG